MGTYCGHWKSNLENGREAYCASCKKNTTNKSFIVRRTKQNRLMLVSNLSIYAEKNLASRTEWIIEQTGDPNSIK